jgi:hypothetical protein
MTVGNNNSYEQLGSEHTKRFYGIFLPQYHIKNPTTFSRNKLTLLFLNLRAAVNKKIAIDLLDCQGVAFTADYWTSRAADPYLGMTLHYIDAKFEMQKFMVACKSAEGRHTAVNIAGNFNDFNDFYDIIIRRNRCLADIGELF